MKKKRVDVSETGLSRFLSAARKSAKLEGQVQVLITSSAEIQKLNRQFRHKDEPTDVLSFPAIAEGAAGDIAISADIADANAKRMGHSLRDELRVLILHGVLHLAGYDHHDGSQRMARMEAKLRREFGLPQTLIERAATPDLPRTERRKTKR